MKYLYQFNQFIEKHMIFVAPSCLVAGILLARWLEPVSVIAPVLFFIMAFEGSLGTNFKSVGHVAMHPVSILAVLVILHVIMPLLAFFISTALFGDNPQVVTGFVLEALIPAAIVSLTWSSIYHGNAALSLSIVIVDTVLAPFLIPVILKIMLGKSVTINTGNMIVNLLILIALPAFLAMLLNQVTHDKAMQEFKPRLKPFSKMCMIGIITLNSTKAAPYVWHLTPTRILIALLMWVVVFAGFGVSYLVARLMRRNQADTISILFGGGLRNISAGAVIAVAYFPGEAIFPVMMGTLFQQMTAGILSKVLFSRVFGEEETKKS